MRIGVDVGGTNTDAVLMKGKQVLAFCKKNTSTNISDGIVGAISSILLESGASASDVDVVMIGTTHFTNAFVERRNLLPVGIVRICLPATKGVPPLVDWPDDLSNIIGSQHFLIAGGHQFDGRLNCPLDEKALETAAKQMRRLKIKSIAITAVFSPINPTLEERAAEIIRSIMGHDVAITLSHQLGTTGIIERENATIMNASLALLANEVVRSFKASLEQLNIKAPFFISQNDGTLMSATSVEKHPVLTFASGPTNSMRGAAYLTGFTDALVADIGGTTTDVGMLVNGFPRESSVEVDIGGVRTNFRMPDILSIGLGGGSVVLSDKQEITIGPQSVGYQLQRDSLIFGGSILTASDVAVAAGYASLGDASLVHKLDKALVKAAARKIHSMLEQSVDRMKISADSIPLILVGGGAILIQKEIAGVSQVISHEFAGVANAIGAAIAQVGGEIDVVTSYSDRPREVVLAEIKAQAIECAIQAGAQTRSTNIVDIEEYPLAYAPNGAVRVRVKAVGNLQGIIE